MGQLETPEDRCTRARALVLTTIGLTSIGFGHAAAQQAASPSVDAKVLSNAGTSQDTLPGTGSATGVPRAKRATAR